MSSRPIITRDAFYHYLKCPSWFAREVEFAHAGDAMRTRLEQDGLLPDIERAIIAKRGVAEEIVEEDVAAAARATLDAMTRGVPVIFRGALTHGHHVARPDVLERVEGHSLLGDYYYVACDIKRGTTVREEARLQGCFYAEALEILQGVRPVQGYLLHPDGTATAYFIEEMMPQYRATLDAMERILEGEHAQHFLTSDCKRSPWFHECMATATQGDDLSRINRIWRSEARAIHDAGFPTVAAFAGVHEDIVQARVNGIPSERLRFLHTQARALAQHRIFRLGPVDLPAGNDALVFDVESDPWRNVHTLLGVLEVGGETATFHPFVARDPSHEQEMWESFLAFVRARVGVPIYHYGTFEVDVVRGLGEKYGTPTEIIADIEERCIDLLVRLRERIIFPLSFYALKDIAAHLGFRWRDTGISGIDAILLYEEWLTKGDAAALEKMIRYNEDDVRATWHVVQWARG